MWYALRSLRSRSPMGKNAFPYSLISYPHYPNTAPFALPFGDRRASLSPYSHYQAFLLTHFLYLPRANQITVSIAGVIRLALVDTFLPRITSILIISPQSP